MANHRSAGINPVVALTVIFYRTGKVEKGLAKHPSLCFPVSHNADTACAKQWHTFICFEQSRGSAYHIE